MAFASSYICGATIRDALKNAIALNIAGSSPDAIKCALFTNSITNTHDTDPQSYSVSPWNANEASGTGYTAGGTTLSTVTNVLISGVGIGMDADDTSWSTSTITARGCLVYDNTLSPKAGIVSVNFGADYSTTAGTFQITWDANGLWRIDLTP